MTLTTTPDDGEGGFTLVELLIYAALLVVIALIAGGLLFSSSQSSTTVRTVTDATNLGQEIQRGIDRSVRNATAIQDPYSPTLAAVGVSGTQLLVIEALTGGSVSATQCQAWFYVPSRGGQLFVRTVSPLAHISPPDVTYVASVPAGTSVKAPAGWQSYGEGINPDGALPFTRSGKQIGTSLAISAGAAPKIRVSSSSTGRQPIIGATSPCF